MTIDRPIRKLRAARRLSTQRRRELDAARGGPGGSRHRQGVVIVLAVVAVALAGVAVWQYASAPRHYSDAEYVAATTDRVGLLLEADSDDPGRAGRILSGATGEFHDAFAQSADAYTQFVTSAKTRGAGSVDGVGLARRNGDSALMLVAANVRVATATGQDATAGDFRMRVLMTPEDDELKIAAVEVLR
ncbi:hypothetical protein L5I01_18515 [Gordonia sp. HY442]|uniref:hypothetical protein n=1 Tax=Gordonia zhenghanii TaxID=2911516 RepID=UPI001F3FB343|nr:hypothetical protein [Gordonia zhenghanii]MCF8605349.1 hypothetical protein [Gordonia zhenghanii]